MLAVANRQYKELHADRPHHDGTFTIWQKDYSDLTPWHYMDGVTIYLSAVDDNPSDAFTTDEFARPYNEKRDPGAGGNQPGA